MSDTATANARQEWLDYIDQLYFVYQPIVNIHTGMVYGFESLLRGWKELGFKSIPNLFDRAYVDDTLFELEKQLLEKAVIDFKAANLSHLTRLFFNVDQRIIEFPDYNADYTSDLIRQYGLSEHLFCFEFSELYGNRQDPDKPRALIDSHREIKNKVVLDDFGSGGFGLQFLYHALPDLIKINRSFLEDIAQNSRKKMFVTNMINMAIINGIQVIAEGVESEREFNACKEIGCSMVQGFFIERPVRDLSAIPEKYEAVADLGGGDRRAESNDQEIISSQIDYIEPVYDESGVQAVLQRFRDDQDLDLVPVLNHDREPVGILREKSLKRFVYARYGREILRKKEYGHSLSFFLERCPLADINTPAKKMLDLFAEGNNTEGIIITENGIYKGFLSAKAMLIILNLKELEMASDQNPLSKLPGNYSINEYVTRALKENVPTAYVYFDFDFFKPYNDKYGFRQGDRVILLFADILRQVERAEKCFIAHIGGDDFFAAFNMERREWSDVYNSLRSIIERYHDDARAFYDDDARERGFITAKGRDGRIQTFPLLSISVAATIVRRNTPELNIDSLGNMIANLKKQAKQSEDKIAYLHYPDERDKVERMSAENR